MCLAFAKLGVKTGHGEEACRHKYMQLRAVCPSS